MFETELKCPVCEEYCFDTFDDYVTCPVCGWDGNIPQFKDHNLSDGRNALSVNEYKIQRRAILQPGLRDTVLKMQRAFLKKRWDIKELSRDLASGCTADDWALMLPALVEVREDYVASLNDLIKVHQSINN